VRRDLAEARGEFGPNHPRILTAEAQLGDIRGSIGDEIGKIVQGLRSRVEAERQRETEIRGALDQLAGKLAVLKGSEVQLRALEREAEALRGQLESLLARAQETQAQEDFQRADATVISRAEVPSEPSFPNKRLLMLACLFVSTATGVSLAYALQALDDRFRTASQVRDELGVPVIELIPLLRRRGLRRPSPFRAIVDAPASAFAEALRNLQVSLLGGTHPPKTLLFTSSLPKEGKTSLTLAFGRFLAMANRQVVVVDCDVRMSSVHKFTSGRPAPGLMEHLLEAATLDEIIQVDQVTGMRYISSGQLAGNPPDLFSSHRMRNLLRELAQSHDVVLIDSAPVLAVADTRCLHPLVDQTVFVIRWRQTRRHVAREALRRLEVAGYDTLSVVLNHVDPKSYQKYDYGYQYDSVKSYYGT
jgi:polysaccharide biosynthesis transport protein